jgi:hypothetical protein
VSTISPSRTNRCCPMCDNFLYVFKGTACGRASRRRARPGSRAQTGHAVPGGAVIGVTSWTRGPECKGYCSAPGVAVLPAASALGERPARATAPRPGRPAPGALPAHRRHASPARLAASCSGAGGPSSSRAVIVSPCKITGQERCGLRPPRRCAMSQAPPLTADLPRRAFGTCREDGGRAERRCVSICVTITTRASTRPRTPADPNAQLKSRTSV